MPAYACHPSGATSQPHAAYTAFTRGLAGKWAYIARTISNVEDLDLYLYITGQDTFDDK